jgi:hypothetical protein
VQITDRIGDVERVNLKTSSAKSLLEDVLRYWRDVQRARAQARKA